MSLSSNSIIHFTSSIDSIKGILLNNFKIKYCKETIVFDDANFEIMVPMVSFCDIPLSSIKEHINKYGNYGIGFTKKWAEQKGLNPVLYLEKNSLLNKSFADAYEQYICNGKDEISLEDLDYSKKTLLDMFRYIKNYQADLIRKTTTIKDYRFSDEREWRFVPEINENIFMCMDPDYASDDNNQDEIQSNDVRLKELTLTFTPDDIKYLIIENDNEIHDLLNFLKTEKGNDYSYKAIERLSTRILTTDQINSDI